jgi:hypothetical protein
VVKCHREGEAVALQRKMSLRRRDEPKGMDGLNLTDLAFDYDRWESWFPLASASTWPESVFSDLFSRSASCADNLKIMAC